MHEQETDEDGDETEMEVGSRGFAFQFVARVFDVSIKIKVSVDVIQARWHLRIETMDEYYEFIMCWSQQGLIYNLVIYISRGSQMTW